MTCAFRAGMTALAASLVLTLSAGASPAVSKALTRPQVYEGLFGKLFRPKIDLGKTGRALTYPAKKAVINGGKAAVGAAASYYFSSKKPGIASVLPKK